MSRNRCAAPSYGIKSGCSSEMLDFEIFTSALRHVFSQFIGIRDLTSEAMATLPDKYQSITAKMELSGETQGTLWLNISHPGVKIAMEKLNVQNSDEDRMLMDTAG